MTPIESIYDVRIATLVGVAIDALETLSVAVDVNPEQLLSDYLYLATKRLHERGEEVYMTKLLTHYPLLKEAID